MTTTAQTERHFLRCPECLFVWAVEIPPVVIPPGLVQMTAHARISRLTQALAPYMGAGCAIACGCERAEHMGRLNPITSHLQKEKVVCACDHSCTHARGPDCECPCGGANHGAGMLADYIVMTDTGKLSAKMKHVPKNAQQAIDRAFQWRGMSRAIADAVERITKAEQVLAQKKSDSRWLNGPDYLALSQHRHNLDNARKLAGRRTHDGRMKAANEVIAYAAALQVQG